MSEMKLSQELIASLQQTVAAHDKSAEDTGVMLQYLAAVIGFHMGHANMADDQKNEFSEQLFAFAKHVQQDIEGQQKKAAPAPAPEEAFGIWRPE